MVRYLVITEAEENISPDNGNICDSFIYVRKYYPLKAGFVKEPTVFVGLEPINPDEYDMIHVKKGVFVKGEILIIDENGREVAGQGRKPSKWDVNYETFDNVDDAIKLVNKISD